MEISSRASQNVTWFYPGITQHTELIGSHLAQQRKKIISAHLVSPHLIFYFWLSGLIMMEILQGYPFSERNDLKVSLTERTELRMTTVVPRALPSADGGLTVVCVCTLMYVCAHVYLWVHVQDK